MTEQLTKQDVERLLTQPAPTVRVDLARKVAAELGRERLSPNERQIAEEIVRLMVKDVAVKVRQTLAEGLKATPGVPPDVAMSLARDVDAVALPILEMSNAFSDADLIELVRGGSNTKRAAIARRPTVSGPVADALIEKGDETVVATLVANEGATIEESGLKKALDRFGDNEAVNRPMTKRSKLPITIAERLVALVSENLREYLVTHHELSATTATDLVFQSRERALVSLVASDADEVDVERLVRQLHQNGRLTPSLVLRALCMGDVALFEASLAALAQIPVTNARLLIYDAGPLGLKSIYEKSGLPVALLPAVRVAIDVARQTDFDGEEGDLERRRRRMIERILTQFEDLGSEDLDYLLKKLSDLMTQAH